MQRSAFQERPGYIQIAQQDYPYLLSYLSEKFGDIRRAGNTFWTTNGRPQMAAVIVAPDRMMLPGKSMLSPETLDIPTLINAQRKRGRLIRVWKQVHFCDHCLAFYTFPEERDSHEHGGTMHPLRRVGEFSYRRYVPEREPIYRRKGWVSPKFLFSELAEQTGPEMAWRLVNLRINGLREGKCVTIEELLKNARNPEALFESVVFERAFAYEDQVEAARIRIPRRAKKVGLAVPTARPGVADKQSASPMGVTYGEQTFLDWRVKYEGKLLTRDQKLAVALQFGIPLCERRSIQPRSGTKLSKAMSDAVADSILIGAEDEPSTISREEETRPPPESHWRVRRRHPRKPYTWKDARRQKKSIRYDDEDHPYTTTEPQQLGHETQQTANVARPSREEEAKLREDAKKKFFETFNLTQADVLYEQEDGFVKAQKTIFTQLGTRRIEVFNRPLMPQRIVGVGEFDEASMQIADELAGELSGRVLVTEQRKRSMKSLAVVVGSFTVRVASLTVRPRSPSSGTRG